MIFRVFLYLLAGCLWAAGQEYVWFEAEDAGGDRHEALSEGAMVWRQPGTHLQRKITIPTPGTYTLWVRKFWNPQEIRWRVGEGEWVNVPARAPLQDVIDLAPGRRVGWFPAGQMVLSAGETVFEMEVTDDSRTTAYDCFLLTKEPFLPRGKLKPDEKLALDVGGWFAFDPGIDTFKESPMDLRWLNEREAGENGFISVRGDEFIHSKTGRPIRFWAVNTGNEMARRSNAEIDQFARFLAKRGVNLVRLHGPIYKGSGENFDRIDTAYVERLHYLIAALKREGIYSCLSIYFPLWVKLGPENRDFPGYNGQHPFGLLYFNEKFQELYRSWWKYLLITPNPYTGLALRDDPAVAMAELVNEDSLFFWTFNPGNGERSNVPEPQRQILEKRFGEWLLERYPKRTLEQIREVEWGGLATPHDDFTAGRVGIRPLWSIAHERTPRDRDTARFLAEVQRDFYRKAYSYLKEDLGFQGLVSASNWQTASAKYLGPIDKWTNTCTDFMDRHGYFGGRHVGEAAGYSIREGQRYKDRSALFFRASDGMKEDYNNPLFDIAYAGQPSVISEVGWTLPNRFRAEFPVLAAVYGTLQGSDAIFHFAANEPVWGGLPRKFGLQTPTQMGQYPATAFLFRQGLLKKAPAVVQLQLSVDDILNLKGTPVPAPQNFDELRSADIPPGGMMPVTNALDPLAFLVGSVKVDFLTEGEPHSQVMDLSPYLRRQEKKAKSLTGELEWDWDRGLVTIHGPAAQGMTGFLSKAGKVELPDVVLESPMEYGSILLVPLDGQPLVNSGKILLQVMSEERPHRWETADSDAEGLRAITNTGEPPLLIKELEGHVALKRKDAAGLKVTVLDVNGYPTGDSFSHGEGISLQRDKFYYLIEASQTVR